MIKNYERYLGRTNSMDLPDGTEPTSHRRGIEAGTVNAKSASANVERAVAGREKVDPGSPSFGPQNILPHPDEFSGLSLY